MEDSSRDPTFKMPGTTQNLYKLDSCINCVKKSWLAVTTLNAKQLYSSVNVVTLKLKCNWLQSLENRYETFYAAPPHHSFNSLHAEKKTLKIHENCICIHTCIYVINHNGYFKRKKLFCVTSSVEIFQSSNMKFFAKFTHRMMLWSLWLDDERHGLYLNSQDAAWKVKQIS